MITATKLPQQTWGRNHDVLRLDYHRSQRQQKWKQSFLSGNWPHWVHPAPWSTECACSTPRQKTPTHCVGIIKHTF